MVGYFAGSLLLYPAPKIEDENMEKDGIAANPLWICLEIVWEIRA